jgi:hypothetical protein
MHYLARVRVRSVVEEGHGQLVSTKQDRVRVMLSRRQTRAEVIESGLGDDPSVA